MTVKLWDVISSEQDKSYGIFSFRTDRAISPRTGLEYDFYILESTAWVNIIPLTQENEVILIRQYRHGIQNLTLEIPGGLVEGQDTPEEAAVREALEETSLEVTLTKQFHTYSDPSRDPRQHTASTVFIGTAVGKPKAGDDAAGADVFTKDNLPNLVFDHAEILADYFNSKADKD